MSREIRWVEWVDSNGGSRWISTFDKAAFKMSLCESVGYVFREDDESVCLAQSLDDANDNIDNWIAIPKVAIVRATTIRKARP